LSRDYIYVPEEYKCWISFDNFRGLLLALLFVYNIPVLSIALIYIRILRYVRENNHLQQRREANKRDVQILRRIVVLVLGTVVIGVPTVIIVFIYIISHYLIPHAHDIQGLTLSITLFAAALCFTFITPELKEIWNRSLRQIHPITITRQNNIRPIPSISQATVPACCHY
jgi:hypothetical protein